MVYMTPIDRTIDIWCSSHYSFHLVLWHIPLSLLGQWYDAVQQKLTFEPKL